MRPLTLARPPRRLAVPVTPLVDVLLILLIFFMVTSTYLDLDMIPMTEGSEPPAVEPMSGGTAAGAAPLLVRLDAGGRAVVAGRMLDPAAAGAEAARRGAAAVLILPSPRAPVQALVDVLGAIRAAGITRITVVRLEAEP
jgi:biopolymer transport protein ExbD